MRRSGFIVRFVDIVLILLFGFISISSIRETRIQLPHSQESQAPLPDVEEVVFIGITSAGTYLVDQERTALQTAGELREFISDRITALSPNPVKVRIRASHDTPMGYLVVAANVCDALGVPKAFEVEMQTGSG